MSYKNMMMAVALTAVGVWAGSEPSIEQVEQQFRTLPKAAQRLTGPLFWLHGDESKEQLENYLEKVAESGNGSFTAESRPHNDWLGEGWYRDLDICLKKAKQLDLQMWIFDEKWWPSQSVGGKVPLKYAAKMLVARAVQVQPGGKYVGSPGQETNFIALVAGRLDAGGAVESDTLCDLTQLARKGAVKWTPPADQKVWQVMTFAWEIAPKLKFSKQYTVDGMSTDCVDWYIRTVYEPHYARFGKDFGKTIPGYFYDEPETPGDWGTELNATFKARGVEWMPAYVAWKFKLSGEAQAAAKYQYAETRAETWGRVMYGGITEWCHKHGALSIGHFMEHGMLYVNNEYSAGDMMRLQKYSDMGAIDMVCRQMYPGQRPHDIYQTPKLGSSVSHVYGKADDRAMCEIYGGYRQVLTYPEMKWLCDQHQVRGINFLIPHSFNPRAPRDEDFPPYFYNGGFEPRYPLYRVWADYSSRLSLMLTGGHHVAPVAVLFSGNTKQVGDSITPEDITSVMQDALYDCDWLPFERFEDRITEIKDGALHLYGERYRILIVPPVEVMPYATMKKVKEFFDKGGIVVGYNFLPSKSATIGRTASDIAELRTSIWGDAPQTGVAVCKTSAAGGHSYFLPAAPTVDQLQQAFATDAGIHPALEVIEGETSRWLHVLHRVKAGRDVFLVCNQNHTGDARNFTFRVTAVGEPECWDAMRNELTAVPFKRLSENQVDVSLTLEPSESVVLVFQKEKRQLPQRLHAAIKPLREPIPVVRETTPPALVIPGRPPAAPAATKDGRAKRLTASPVASDPFVGHCELPADVKLDQIRVFIELDELAPEEAARVTVNGTYAGGFIGRPFRLEVTRHVKSGANTIVIEPFAPKTVRLTCDRAVLRSGRENRPD